MKWRCFFNQCEPDRFLSSRLIEVTEKKNRSPLYLREFIGYCRECGSEKISYVNLNDQQAEEVNKNAV